MTCSEPSLNVSSPETSVKVFALEIRKMISKSDWRGGSIPGLVKSDAESQRFHRCDVSSELCCPGAKPSISPLVTLYRRNIAS